jgi:hypothetical protein
LVVLRKYRFMISTKKTQVRPLLVVPSTDLV